MIQYLWMVANLCQLSGGVCCWVFADWWEGFFVFPLLNWLWSWPLLLPKSSKNSFFQKKNSRIVRLLLSAHDNYLTSASVCKDPPHPRLEKIGSSGTWFPRNFDIWTEFLPLKYRNGGKYWREILIVFPGKSTFFPAENYPMNRICTTPPAHGLHFFFTRSFHHQCNLSTIVIIGVFTSKMASHPSEHVQTN